MPFVSDQTLTYPALAARVLALPPSCGPVRVVAIDGPSGAGKSTFAPRLSAALEGVPVVRSDDFRVPWDADPLTWWKPLEDAVLAPLAAGRPAVLRRYDWHRDVYADPEEIPTREALIIEGVGAAWEGSPAACRIWIDAPRDVRRARALARDGAEWADAWDAWATREERHFTSDRTRTRIDLSVDGTRVDATTFATLP
jgi:uridine kinase